MKVIFIKDLKGKGKKDEIKEVSDGYAINYLIKNKYAVKYTKSSKQKLDYEVKIRHDNDLVDKNQQIEIKKQIENVVLNFKVNTSKDRVFGTISTKQIVECLKNDYNIKIDKKKIKLDIPISSLGTHNVKVELRRDVIATIKVHVEAK